MMFLLHLFVDGAVKVVCVVPVPFTGSRLITWKELWGEDQEGSSIQLLGKEEKSQ